MNVLKPRQSVPSLDVDTLELLEELVSEFEGTVLLVSHDRVFLDNVVTSTLVFDGTGKISEHVGGYTDWLRYEEQLESDERQRRSAAKSPVGKLKTGQRKTSRKLSYKDKRELDSLPAEIESLESEQTRLHDSVNEPGFYDKPREDTSAVLARLDEIHTYLATRYARWESLEDMRDKTEKGVDG